MRAHPASILNRCLLALAALPLAVSALAQTAQVKIGSLDLTIGGIQATVTPAKPAIPKDVASGVQIIVTQNGQQLSAAAVAQYLGGPYQLFGEYSGPGLTQTVEVSQPSPTNNSLVLDLPAVTTAGNYTLSNVRFVVNGATVMDVMPSTITVQVIDQVLVTSVQTTPLTLDQIQAMGVVLDSSAYTGFQFTVGLQFSSQVVSLSFPVVFNQQGVPIPQPLTPPAVSPVGVSVPLPTIVPVLLQAPDGSGPPQITLPDGTTASVKIPSVIVIPGNVGYLKQFFSAQLYVSDGAPGGSNLIVDGVTGTINLPQAADGVTADNPLALPNLTSGPQSETMNVLAPDSSGTPSVASLNPGDTGQAEWTIRGDKEGYYTINFNINATLEGLPTGPFPLSGTATGGVLVRNPYFDMTFTVPGVVRKGELFNVYTTVTNVSQVAANNLTVNFDQSALSGVTLVSPPSPVVPTLNAGDSTTLTFQFQSLQTGQAVASYLNFNTTDGTTGNLNFTLGVFANGTPQSPDTLVLPSSVDNLPSDVVDAAMRVLGEAWSVATASTLPAGVTRTSRSVVTQKALALAEAGLRQSLGEPLPNALRDLGTDFFGGSPIDPGFDQVLRTTPAGQNFVKVLGANLAQPAVQAGGASAYELQLAQIEASGPNFMTFAVGNGTGAAPVSISLTDGANNQMASTTPGGSVPGGAIFPLGTAASVPYLGLLTSPTNSPYTLLLTGQSSGSADISLSIPAGNGTVIRGTASGVAVVSGHQMRVVADFTNPTNLLLQVDSAGNGTFSTSIPLTTQVISPPGPSLIAATVIDSHTVSQASNFGQNLVILFDRVVDGPTSATASNYSIPNNSVLSASKQLSGRLVFANLAQPEGSYVPTTFATSGVADQRGVVGTPGSANLRALLADPGAVVTGRVLASDGKPITNATVVYVNTASDPPACQNINNLGIAAVPVLSDGSYQFRYVHQDQCGGSFQISTQDPTTGVVRQVNAYVRTAGQQIVLDLALLGKGSVSGVVTDLTGAPVYNAQVVAVSGTDPQVGGSAFTDANGKYTITGITVGPVTVTAAKGISLGSSPGNIERAGTTAVVNVTLNGGAVNVSGTVTLSQGTTSAPVPGAPVAYYLVPSGAPPFPVGVAITATDGSYSIKAMPTGPYKVQVVLNSQLSASQSGVAAAGENLTIPLQIVSNATPTGTVKGTVFLPNGSAAGGVVVYQGQSGVLSNPDGTYSLPGVPVLPTQSQTINARTQDALRSGQASFVVTSATTPVTNVNITLSGLGTVQFTVRDATGKTIPGQTVSLIDGYPDCGGPSQKTDASGIATFTGLPVGTVRAAALLTGGAFSDLAIGTATITQDGTTGYGTLQFNGAGTVTGIVIDPTNKPVFGAVIQLTSNSVDLFDCALSQNVTQTVQTDTSGKFQFSKVNVGQVGVTASQSFYPTQVGAQGTLLSNGATINFPLQLVNTTSGVLSGTIFLPDGVTAAGAGVQVTANGALPNVTVSTDASGNYKFAKIFPQGSYTLTVNDPVSGGTNQIQIYLRAGQDTTQNLRLKGTGTVNVTVVDGAGIPVSTAFVTLNETNFPNASFTGSLDASNQGVLPFPNVFEGGFAVQVTDPLGRGGRTSGTLPQGTASVNALVQLTATGTVQGHFFMPDGSTPIPNASVNLTANGRTIGQVTSLPTGDVGSYSFQYVPAGPVQLKALDPLTGRTGIAAGTIASQGQTLTLDVIAQGLDTVQGVVTSNGSPQPGATVTITSGNFQATTQADATGMYLMNGVPEGVIVATASLGNGYLSGTASATILGDANTLTLDVALRGSGTVSGKVLQADGVNPAPPSTVSISVGGVGGGTETTTTDTQGHFSLQNVPAGSGTISVQVLGGIDQAVAPVSVAAGTTTNVSVTLNGIGAISGVAEDSSGNPTAGSVTLTGTGTFPYYFSLTTGTDGKFSVPQILAGPFTAKLSTNIGGFTLFGTATGSVSPGQTANVTIQVQPSGTVTGLVLRPDGKTPAVGANISIRLQSGGSVTVQAQNDGTFTADGIPLSAFSVFINDPSTNSLAGIEGLAITTNGQTVNLGTITLDGNALSVVSSNPASGATGVGINQAITVTFSEALAGTNGISLSNGTNVVPMTVSLSSDGKTVTLQGTMPDGIPLSLNLSTQISDIFGRQFLQAQTITFTTVDLTPPRVVSISPSNGAIQVPDSAVVVVTFNKALATTGQPANVVTVNAGAVPGVITQTAPNVLTFTPSAALSNNTIYSVTVSGAVSFGGNVQTAPSTSDFISPETTPPALQLNSPANGSTIGSSRPAISISVADALTGVNPATATLAIDGQAVTPSANSTQITYAPPAALPDGTHTLAASVQNYAGILGTLSSSFVIDTAPPSIAALSGITAGQTLQGQVSISASATDSIAGIDHINLLLDGAVLASFPSPSFAITLDTTKISEGPHNFAVQAVNKVGTSGPTSAAIQAYIENVALSVSITSPMTGQSFKTQVAVTAVPSEPVQKIAFSLGTQTVTATTSPYQATLSLAGVADGPQIITATDYDFAGRTASAFVTILVMQTPPAAPNANAILVEPPVNGVSLIDGMAGAVSTGGLKITATDKSTQASATATSAADGSFTINLADTANDNVSITATDIVGNVSTATVIPVPPPPSITSLSPTSGTVGASVTITGTSFGSSQNTSTVTFNGAAAAITSWSAAQIVASVPASATTGTVVVTVGGAASNGVSFTVIPTPAISNISPSAGPPGTLVTLTGTNFGATQGSSTLTFSGTAAASISSWSNTQIVVAVPNGAPAWNIVVTVNAVASNAVVFNVTDGYIYSRPITISHTQVPNTDQINFPVAISGTYPYLATAANGGNVTSANGYDIIFTSDAAGLNVLPFEREAYNASTGAVVFWVQIPLLSHTTDTTFYMFYGNPLVTTDQSNKAAVWDSNFKGVWHLSETSGQQHDSTSNGNHSTAVSVTAEGTATGEIGGADQFNASHPDHVDLPNVPLTTAFTLEAWIFPTSYVDYGHILVKAFSSNTAPWSNYYLNLDTAASKKIDVGFAHSGVLEGLSSTATIPLNQWTHAVGTYDGSNVRLFLNGAQDTAVPASGAIDTVSQTTEIGYNNEYGPQSFTGDLEEIRISSVARSADWIATEYNNQTNPSAFYAIAASNEPQINSLSPASGVPGTSVTITGQDFGATQGISTVSFNGVVASVSSWSPTSIVATVPSGATNGYVVVAVNSVASNGVYFRIWPAGWSDQDVGAVGPAGSASWSSGTFTVQGAGNQIGSNATDELHFVYQPLTGDGTIVARLSSLTGSYINNDEAGLMIRETLSTGSTMVAIGAEPHSYFGSYYFRYRTTTGASQGSTNPGSTGTPVWMKLVRSGNTFTAYLAPDGINWVQQGSTTVTMATSVYVGMYVNSSNTGSLATGTFDNVSVSSAAAPAPVITGISATTASVGSQVVVSGTGFGATQGGSLLTLNAAAAPINFWSDTSITFTVPAGATSGYLVVSVAPEMNNSNPVYFEVTGNPLPVPWLDQDVGLVGQVGGATFASGTFTVQGAGNQIGSNATDELHFVYQALTGDGTIVARLGSLSGSYVNNDEAGVMIRETLSTGSTMVAIGAEPHSYYGSYYFRYRATTGASQGSTNPGSTGTPVWMKLVRSGNTFTAYLAPDGINWVQQGSTTVTMATSVYVGMYVNSSNTGSLATGTFDNVSVSSTAVPGPVIRSVSATTGSIGSQVIISGSGFGATQGNSQVILSGLAMTINSWSDTSITMTIASGAATGYLIVSVAPEMNDSNPVYFTVTSNPLPAGWLDQDVGPLGVTGNATYSSGTFTLQGAGNQIGSNATDELHFVYQPLTGDGTIVARLSSLTGSYVNNDEAGVMIRETLSTGSTMVAIGAEPHSYYGSYYFRYRATTGASQGSTNPGSTGTPVWMKLVRSGNTFTAYLAPDGINWVQEGSTTVTMATSVYVGMYVNSSNTGSLATGTFDNVSISPPEVISHRKTNAVLDYNNPLSTNLMGLFLMNEGSGTTDTNLYDGMLATFAGTNQPTWNTSDPSMVFGGGPSLSSYLDAGADISFDQLPTSQITVVAEVYVNTLAAAGVAEKNDGGVNSGFVFGWDSTGALHLTVEKSGTPMRVNTAGAAVPGGRWAEVAFTWDGTVGTGAAAHLFVNGVEQTKTSSSDGTGAVEYANATNQPLRIGTASFDSMAGSLNGRMAYLAVYKGRILTTTELNELMIELPIK